MKKWLHEVEIIVDRIIPYLVILLIFLIAIEIFFYSYAEPYIIYIEIADQFIIFVFVLDLIFKFNRVRKIKIFLKKYWLDILAVFPFFLLFRAVEELALLFRFEKELAEGQKIVHSGLEVQKIINEEVILKELKSLEGGQKVISEIGESTKFARTEFIVRFLRPLQRIPRLFKIYPVYEKPIKKEVNIIERGINAVEKNLGIKKRR
ncbi:hypothetical protein J4425_02895 [Candidatus Woesearchaeota archaeon]|nr:hypothetical protein [Candidatus Woesearchaeota archaeon]